MVKPNVLLILADDFGYGDLGAFGNPDVRTPNLDALAKESVRLWQHYSAAPVCAPARAGLLTGRYPIRTGVIDTLEARGTDRLALSELTLADMLRAQGYTTGLFGKWHVGALDARFHPNRRGFEVFCGFCGGWSDYYAYHLDRNGALSPSRGRYITDVITEEAVEFISRQRRQPFFAHVTYSAPHFPFQAPDREVQVFREMNKFNETVCTIYAMNKCMDDGIGRLLSALDEKGLAENTIVIFTSDNGPEAGRAARFNGPLSGSKGHVYEGGIRTPALVRWPAGGVGNRDEHAMMTFLDYVPTLLGACGVAPPAGLHLDGRDALPLLRGEAPEDSRRCFWQWTRYAPNCSINAAVRDGAWKLVRGAVRAPGAMQAIDAQVDKLIKEDPNAVHLLPPGPPILADYGPPAPTMLFNIVDDPGEHNNLAAVEPERLARMEAMLDAWYLEVETERQAQLLS